MKIINEAKEKLPVEFITSLIGQYWTEVGNLKSTIEGAKKEFAGATKLTKVLEELQDAYLIALGQLEGIIDGKIEMPELKEALTESNKEDAEPVEALKFEDNNKTEVFTELPDYDVEVEQKGDKIEIELEPKVEVVNDKEEDEERAETEVPEEVKIETSTEEEPIEIGEPEVVREPADFIFDEFPEVEITPEDEEAIRQTINR